jgi:hypothetical protein
LLQPLASLLFQDRVPPAITRLLPKELQSVKVSDFMQKNRCREVFSSLLSTSEEQIFILATAIVHACVRNRKALPLSFFAICSNCSSGSRGTERQAWAVNIQHVLESIRCL